MATPSATIVPAQPAPNQAVLQPNETTFGLLWRTYLLALDNMLRTAQYGPLPSAANDSAAATAGVPVNGLYQNAGVVRVETHMSLMDLFNNNAQLQAAGTIGAGIQQGERQALPLLSRRHRRNCSNTVSKRCSLLEQNFSTLTAGANQLGNLLGLGGRAGSQRAQQTLQGLPGYQASLGAANAGSAAAQAASGGTGSGNAIIAGAEYSAQNVADTNYNNYVSQLQPFLTGMQNVGGQIANTNMGIGQGVAGGNYNIGNMFYGGATSAANALAAAQANTSGASNLANLGLIRHFRSCRLSVGRIGYQVQGRRRTGRRLGLGRNRVSL